MYCFVRPNNRVITKGVFPWDPSFPLENTKSPPAPKILEKMLKNYNLAHPGTVLRTTEKILQITKKDLKITKQVHS